jgi:hypothetical protein
MQFRDPLNFQATLLSSADVVTTPAQIGFPEMVVPGTAEFAKAVLAREGDLTEVAPFLVLGDLVGEGTMGEQGGGAPKTAGAGRTADPRPGRGARSSAAARAPARRALGL